MNKKEKTYRSLIIIKKKSSLKGRYIIRDLDKKKRVFVLNVAWMLITVKSSEKQTKRYMHSAIIFN